MNRPSGLWILLSAGVLWLSVQDVYGGRVFGKSNRTTTTIAPSTEHEDSDEESITTEPISEGNVTKPPLTGNPQIDYIWDPNLPKELNGYNLSDYPFYERVPKDIDFKCDGLHDGFYASVKHKCQVYHHCLYGTRYDFLCANYTAFDQKTFICHFASEVDCNNSKKFWHRNDALYQAATTTTARTILTTPVHTHPPAPAPTSKTSSGQRRLVSRPFRRRRPQFEYYDEYYDFYYEDRPRSRGRKRPRPRPRPLYDDEYDDEYDEEEERYERRGSGGRRNEQRQPYTRRPGVRGRNKDRAKVDYEDEDEDDLSSRRQPAGSEEVKTKKYSRRHPPSDSIKEDKSSSTETKGQRHKSNPNTRTIIKPVSGTVYDRPRVAPKINLPVPRNEAKKYAYKPLATTENSPEDLLEYNDDYEEVKAPASPKKNRPVDERRTEARKPASSTSRSVARKAPSKPLENEESPRQTSRKKPFYDDYYYEYEDDQPKTSSKQKADKSTTTSTTTTTMAPLENIEQPLIRLVKRPFLPSRGGNPYTARGLQPVGDKVPTKTKHFQEQTQINNDEFKPSVDLSRSPLVTSAFLPSESFQAEPDYTKQKTPAMNPLDVNEYDVTLNDALNPTIPNIVPVQSYPTGFDIRNDYTYSSFQRPRYSSDQAVATASTDYSFRLNPVNQRYEVSPQMSQGDVLRSNVNYKGQYNLPRDQYRPRQTQQNTQAFYARYVYHHCLFGQRYDFLCANYTAFDQTLFNCNFVSNVDCINSKKFWSRNDDLYKAQSTTPPPPNPYNFYTTPPPAYSLTPYPVQRNPLPAAIPTEHRRPATEQRRPRPQPPPIETVPRFEYYDEDDYEERPRMIYRRKKRPRPRPVYYDDYDYYDERYNRRSEGRRRRPYERRPMRRNQSRRMPHEYDDDDRYEESGRFVYDDEDVDDIAPVRPLRGSKRDPIKPETGRRGTFDTRRTTTRTIKKRPIQDDVDDYEDEYEDNVRGRTKYKDTPISKAERRGTQKMNMKRYLPPSPEYEDETPEALPARKNTRRRFEETQLEGDRPIIKPTSGTIYDLPRKAPRINLPVPKNAADKYSYKSASIERPATDEEQYDDETSAERTSSTSSTELVPEKIVRRRPQRRNRNRGSINDEIQESRADKKQAPVVVKSPFLDEEEVDCSQGNNCVKPVPKSSRNKSSKSRVSVFKTPINPQRQFYPADLTETDKLSEIDLLDGHIDESINEAY